MSIDDVIYDWNDESNHLAGWRNGLEFYDESLREEVSAIEARFEAMLS